MRRLPPSRDPDEKTPIASLAPKLLGLTLGLLLGYLLLPGGAREPAAAVEQTTALSPRAPG
jgi:hypothetical protein